MNTKWVLIEFESLQMIITVLESYKLVFNELNSCISSHSYNIGVRFWKFSKRPRYQAMNTENRATKHSKLSSKMDFENGDRKTKIPYFVPVAVEDSLAEKLRHDFFLTSWESQSGTVTVLIICIKAADFILERTNRELTLDDHFINQISSPKLVWKWITFDVNYFLQFFSEN